MQVAGVDGAPGGWIAAIVTLPEMAVSWRFLRTADELRGLGDRVGIDIPIGLPSGPGPRLADGAARARLPGRGSSVFPTPVRAVLRAPDYPAACEASRAACGRAISKQTWFISPKIAEVDDVVDPSDLVPADTAWLAEVHPEVSFATMACGVPAPPKKLVAGRLHREALLAPWLGMTVTGVAGLVAAAPRPARADDALDALACAWTAWRWSRGVHLTLGDVSARDERGLPMVILA